MDGTLRKNIYPGLAVIIVKKEHQRANIGTQGIVKDILTSAPVHTRGIKVSIAGAGGAAQLPGMLAAFSPLPVIGVPVQSKSLNGLDSLLSIVQMPNGVPVATVAIGAATHPLLLRDTK